MKEKIFGIFAALIVLAGTHNLWFSYKGTLALSTNAKAGTEVSLQYMEKNSDKKITVKAKTDAKGKAFFELKGKKIPWLKIFPPKGTVVSTIKFRRWKTQKIILNGQNEYIGKTLKSRINIDLYNLIVLGGLAYYLGWFLIHSLKYGFPKDDPKLPKMLNVEFLRIVFTLFIAWTHFCINMKFWNIIIGVEFFFILSGFLLVLTFKPERSYIEFLKNSIIRFMPLILFLGAVRCIFHKYYLNTISDFFFLSALGLHKFPGLASGSWYIGILMLVSLFYQYLLKTKKNEDVNVIIFITSLVAAIVLIKFDWGDGDISGRVIRWKTIKPEVIPLPFSILRGLTDMGIGYFIGFFYLQQKSKEIKKEVPFIIEALVLFSSVILLLFESLYPKNPVFMLILFSTLIFLFANKNGMISRFFEKPVFAKCAKYCLSVYLTHFIIAYDFIPMCLKNHSVWMREHLTYTVPLYFLCVVILGVVAHHAIELPATRALKKRWG